MKRDLPYKSGDGLSDYERSRCLLDLHLPGNSHDFPTLVWFHGGGLQDGSKEANANVHEHLTANGIAVASANYRLSPGVSYPAYIEDAAAAVAWVLDRVESHGGDPGCVPVSGQMVVHSTIRAERGIQGYVQIVDGAAPIHHARDDAPPFLNITGDGDNEGRSDENRRFVEALCEAGHGDAVFVEIEGRDHCGVIDGVGRPGDRVAELMVEFIGRS